MVAYALEQVEFLSTPSARRATYSMDKNKMSMMISIHALREEGDLFRSLPALRKIHISIHALREEGDHYVVYIVSRAKNFYPRPPRGGRHAGVHRQRSEVQFLSTPSARRATP